VTLKHEEIGGTAPTKMPGCSSPFRPRRARRYRLIEGGWKMDRV